MKQINAFFFLLAGMTPIAGIMAQTFISGEIRPRAEYRRGYKSLIDSGQTGSLFTEQRTRINLAYAGEHFKAGIVLQDIRIWGSQSQLNKTDGLTSLHEGWGEYRITGNFSAKAGRQELTYDDERLFGGVGWTQQGRSHDLLLLKLEDSLLTIHTGFAYNQNGESNLLTPYTVGNSYKDMQFLWLNRKFGKFSASLVFVNNGLQSPVSSNAARYSQTYGTYLSYKGEKLTGDVSYYMQTGEDAAKNEMNAFYIAGNIQYSIAKTFSAGAGFEHLSGQSQTDTSRAYRDVNHAFNPLYGTGHKFNGYMDYFYVSNHLNSVGLMDVYLRLKYKKDKFTAMLDAHEFLTASDLLDVKELAASGNYSAMNRGLGLEIDLTLVYAVSKAMGIQFGCSHLFATESMEALKGGDKDELQLWGYLMLTFKPEFFKR